MIIDAPFIAGTLGSLVLVIGAAWPESKKENARANHPTKSVKNWLFAIGNIGMVIYSVLGYLNGASVFYIFLESLILVANILMMFTCSDKIKAGIISAVALGLVLWALTLFDEYVTLLLILGIASCGLGYAFKMDTVRRTVALTIGSILIATFSFFAANWIFFWLNVFFGVFSAYYLIRRVAYLSHSKQ